MEIKFKVGDEIEIIKYDGEIFKIGDILKIKKLDSSECCYVSSDYGTLNIGKGDGDICFKIYEKPRFHDAQPGDLLWNDDYGICEIKKRIFDGVQYPIHISSKIITEDEITLDGKRFLDSPKATFFYYTPKNNYLTERPETEVDWSKVPMGTKVKVWNTDEEPQDFCTDYFMGYFPELPKHFWTFNNSDKVEACSYKYCKLAEPCKSEWRK